MEVCAKMSEFEICQQYRLAKDKNKQIQIIADLNACSVKEIMDVLKNNNLIAGMPTNSAKRDKPFAWTPQIEQETEKLLSEGISITEIAERYGTKPQTIYDKRKIRKKEREKMLKSVAKQDKPAAVEKIATNKTTVNTNKTKPERNVFSLDDNAVMCKNMMVAVYGSVDSATVDYKASRITIFGNESCISFSVMKNE